MANLQMLNETVLPMPITRKAIQTAEQFAAAIPNPQKSEQVYLNTLAVQAVHDYLQLMGIDTNLQQSDSWNPVVRMCEDVADLMVTGLGKLECRPILSDILPALKTPIQSSTVPLCPIPLEVQDERIGYIVVDIDQQTKRATLLGFTKTAGTGELFWHQLESVDALLEIILASTGICRCFIRPSGNADTTASPPESVVRKCLCNRLARCRILTGNNHQPFIPSAPGFSVKFGSMV